MDERYCWFHDFAHPFDGISDGWGCNVYQPFITEDGELKIAPDRLAEEPSR